MIKMEGMAPFNLIKGEMDVTLAEAEQALKRFMEDTADVPSLQTTIELLKQLLGVTRVIYLEGAAFLLQDMLLLANRLLDKRIADDQYDTALGLLGQSLFVLGHYLNFIHLRQKKLPVLLVPTLNDIRRLLDLVLVSEFDFAALEIAHHHASELFAKLPTDEVALAEIPERCRRLRHMYQVGLLGIIRDDNAATNLKILNRAMERIARICGDVPISRLWWVACSCIQAFMSGDVEFNVARKIVLRKIDSQLKRLVYEGVSFLNQQPPEALFQECLYLLALSQNVPGLIHDIKTAYDLLNYPLTDTELRQEYLQMNGPTGSVIATVALSLQEELLQIRESVEIGANGMALEPTHFHDAAEIVTRIASTLLMLGLTEAAASLKLQLPILQVWSQTGAIIEDADLQQMADSLMQAENAVAQLRKRYVYDNIPHVSKPAASVSIHQLDEARLLVVGESRVGLSMTKKAITSFIESQYRAEHIENVPDTLHSVAGALQMLELKRAADVLVGCQRFMHRCLSAAADKQPSAQDFDIMADALSSVDYYLESMEERKPIGEGVLDVAEESISELDLSLAR
jgi:hypothetical protein